VNRSIFEPRPLNRGSGPTDGPQPPLGVWDQRPLNRGDGPTDNPQRVPEIFERRELNRGDVPVRVGLQIGEAIDEFASTPPLSSPRGNERMNQRACAHRRAFQPS
jgi:hypothetical protein